MKLIFKEYISPKPKIYTWKIEVPVELRHQIQEELIKIYGEDVKYAIDSYIDVDVYRNEDETNLTLEQVLNVHSRTPTEPELDTDILKL